MKRQIISIINIISYAFLIWASISVNAAQVFMGTGGVTEQLQNSYKSL